MNRVYNLTKLNNLMSLNNYINYNIWFINLCNLIVGLYFIVINYHILSTETLCKKIYTFLCINVGISIIPIISCSSIIEINVLYFGGSIYLLYRDSLLLLNNYTICKTEGNWMYNYFFISTISICLNEILLLIKFCIYSRICYIKKIINYHTHNDNDNDNCNNDNNRFRVNNVNFPLHPEEEINTFDNDAIQINHNNNDNIYE